MLNPNNTFKISQTFASTLKQAKAIFFKFFSNIRPRKTQFAQFGCLVAKHTKVKPKGALSRTNGGIWVLEQKKLPYRN